MAVHEPADEKIVWVKLTDGGAGYTKDFAVPDYIFLNTLKKQWFFDRNDVRRTMIYTHVLNRGGKGVKSPVDDL